MNKPVYLDLSILAISKTLMHQFWYDYIKPKCKIMLHGYRQLYHSIQTEDIDEDIANGFETRFDTSYYAFKRPLARSKN